MTINIYQIRQLLDELQPPDCRQTDRGRQAGGVDSLGSQDTSQYPSCDAIGYAVGAVEVTLETNQAQIKETHAKTYFISSSIVRICDCPVAEFNKPSARTTVRSNALAFGRSVVGHRRGRSL